MKETHFTNEVFEQIWEDRYCKNGETYEDNLMRVAKFCAKSSEEETQFYNVMRDGLFFPGGRTMSNAGIGSKLTLNNCFVAPAIKDSMEDIFGTVALGARTHQRGGGIGYDFSSLRPVGTKTSNDAVASGPVSFADVFNAQTETILQGNRRGANMGVLSVYHPDILDFINAKANDGKRLSHFNLSVMVDDKFMVAVENNDDIYLHWPVYDDDGKIIYDESKWAIRRKVNALNLWNEIIRRAYENGEPGVLFFDNMNSDNPLYYAESIRSTNPCFTGDMKLLTSDGYKTFEELDGKSVSVIDANGERSDGKVWATGEKDTIKLHFSDGSFITCTPNHVFMTIDGSECCAEDLIGKKIMPFIGPEHISTGAKQAIIENSPRVSAISQNGIQPVYDFNEPKTHWGVVNGLVAHNCAEYLAGTVYNQELEPHQYGGACNLGSLMLHKFVDYPFTSDATLDEEKLRRVIKVAVRMLDNVIDINTFPDKIYENYQKTFRTIGIGVTGLADMLCMLGLKYDDSMAVMFVDELMDKIACYAYRASVVLASEMESFPAFDRHRYLGNGYLAKHTGAQWNEVKQGIGMYGIRNAKIIAIAPTGTMSLVFGNNCSSGIEPIFSLSYDRKVKVGSQSDDAVKIIKIEDYAYHMFAETETYKKTVGEDVFRTAQEISVEAHINMLAAIAKHVDMSVSKTINVPTEYTFEQTKDIYSNAWKLGIKGCTIFRPNELRQGILVAPSNNVDKKADYDTQPQGLQRGDIIDVSDDVIGKKRKLQTGCGSLHCSAFFDPVTGDLVETYLSKGSQGGCANFMVGLSRMISLAARAGIGIKAILDQLNSCGACPSYAVRHATKRDTSKGACCPMAVGNALLDMWNEMQEELNGEVNQEELGVEPAASTITKQTPRKFADSACPECGGLIVAEGGCSICKDCGFSKCG